LKKIKSQITTHFSSTWNILWVETNKSSHVIYVTRNRERIGDSLSNVAESLNRDPYFLSKTKSSLVILCTSSRAIVPVRFEKMQINGMELVCIVDGVIFFGNQEVTVQKDTLCTIQSWM